MYQRRVLSLTPLMLLVLEALRAGGPDENGKAPLSRGTDAGLTRDSTDTTLRRFETSRRGQSVREASPNYAAALD